MIIYVVYVATAFQRDHSCVITLFQWKETEPKAGILWMTYYDHILVLFVKSRHIFFWYFSLLNFFAKVQNSIL